MIHAREEWLSDGRGAGSIPVGGPTMSEADGRDPPEELEELTADEFAAELNRRAAELEASPEAGIPWDEVKEMR
jgi:hypothetical protein